MKQNLHISILDSSGFKNQFFWQLKHAWWWALLLIIILCEKTTKYEEKTQTKSAKTAISGIFPEFSAGKNFFSKIGLGHVLSIVNAHLCAKIQKNDKISTKCQTTGFFQHISGIFGQKNIFFKNRALSHFEHYHFASVCKILWKNIKYRYSRNTVFPAKIGCSGDF